MSLAYLELQILIFKFCVQANSVHQEYFLRFSHCSSSWQKYCQFVYSESKTVLLINLLCTVRVLLHVVHVETMQQRRYIQHCFILHTKSVVEHLFSNMQRTWRFNIPVQPQGKLFNSEILIKFMLNKILQQLGYTVVQELVKHDTCYSTSTIDQNVLALTSGTSYIVSM